MIKNLNFVVTFLTLLYDVSNSCVSMVIELKFYHFRPILLETVGNEIVALQFRGYRMVFRDVKW